MYTHGHEQFEEAFQDHPDENRYNMILLQTHLTYEKQFRNLQIQEAHIDRKRAKAKAELERLQADRRSVESTQSTERAASASERLPISHEEDPELEAIFARRAAILAEHRANWPIENGFVFSTNHSTGSEPTSSDL